MKKTEKGDNLADLTYKMMTERHKHPLNLMFSLFAKKISDWAGHAITFIIALLIILIWGILGPYYKYSDTWQLIINTSTTIITFLIVFLIQNTQNRDTEILNLKIDELIKSHKKAHNELIDLQSLSDVELKELEQQYIKIKDKKTGG